MSERPHFASSPLAERVPISAGFMEFLLIPVMGRVGLHHYSSHTTDGVSPWRQMDGHEKL